MLKTKTTYTLSPGEQKSLELIPSEETDAQEQIGLVEPTVKFEKLGLGLTSKLDKLTKNKTTTLLAISTTEVPLHIRQDSPVATFEIITPEQARYLIPLEPKLFPSSDSKKTIKQIEKSERTAKGEINHVTIKHENGIWFPNPETNPDTSKMSAVEKRIYDKLVKFKNLEAIQPLSKNEDLAGNALNYYLRLAKNTRNDLDDSLEQLRNRYAGADQRRNFELDLQLTKFES